MLAPAALTLAAQIIARGSAKHLTLATAESCTGGLLAAALTAIAGSSAMFERGWVTYSNQAKITELGVSADLLATHGAVSAPVAAAMAKGAATLAAASLGIGITGIAGPGGGTATKPVGLVFVSFCGPTWQQTDELHLQGDRATIRAQATLHALEQLNQYLSN